MKRFATYLLVFVCLLALVGTFSWMALKRGIDIAHFSIASVSFSRLSIRLDRGLILQIDQIDIAATDTPNDTGGLEAQIPRIKRWGHLIQEIDIHRLIYQDYAVGITYRNGQFQVDGTDFILKAEINYDRGSFLFDLSGLEIKPFQLTFKGKGSFERTGNIFLFTGTFKSPWGGGALDIKEREEQVDIRINTERFTDLAAVLKQLPLDPGITTWVAENIAAEWYRIEELRLQFKLSELKDFGPDNIHGTAVANSATVRFHPELDPIQCERINISFLDDRLSFNLVKPTYIGKNLAGSSVSIFPIIQNGSQLVIHIQTETGVDQDILDILDSYNINFPVKQKSGVTKADLTLTFDLPGFSLNTNGTFRTGTGEWLWGEHSLQTEGTVILLNNTITIKEAEISYADILSTTISGRVDLSSKQADLECNIKKLQYKIGETTILEASNKKMPLKIDFGGDTVVVDLEELKTSLHLGPDTKEISIDSLPAITPFVPLLQQLNSIEGHVHTTLQDIDHVQFDGEINFPNPYLSLDDKPVTLFRFQGTKTPEKTDISINDGKIALSMADKLVVHLEEYLVTVDTNTFKDGNKKTSIPFPLQVTGPKTLLKIKTLQFPTGKFEFKASNSDLSFAAQLEKGNFLVESNPNGLNFVGRNLDAVIFDKLVDNADLTKGIFNISLNGTLDKMEGHLELENIHIQSSKLLNNILAFINTIPALTTFSSPGFDRNGYLVKKGTAHFTYHDKTMTIHQLRTDGITVNIELQGWIDQKNRTLKLDAELITLKDYSKIVGKIPLAGYALLGADGSLGTSLEITGSLDAPDIKTNLARDILLTPINVIKRTVQWPFRIFEKDKNKNPELPEPEQSSPEQP